MLKDLEQHKIIPLYTPNKHLVILGASGYGKTFEANRDILHRIRDGDRVIILDISGSYTKEELVRSGNVFRNHICYHKADEDRFEFPVYPEDVLGTITNALIEAFEIGSYNQEVILVECCEELLEATGVFIFKDLFRKLEARKHEYQMEGSGGLPDLLKNTGYLLNKFRPVRNVDNIIFLEHGACKPMKKQNEPVTVLQLSDFSEKQKQRLSVFLLSLIWMNAKHRGKHTLRHTACSRLAESGLEPKVLQYIMGHSNISVTLDIYTHWDFTQIQKKMNALEKDEGMG